MTPMEIALALDEAKRKCEDAEATLELARPQMELVEAHRRRVRADYEEAVQNAKEISGHVNEWECTKKNYENEVERLTRLLNRAHAEEIAQKALIAREEEMDRLTLDAPWRDSIYPYQLEGARRMAAIGRGLLGDVRGLGKSFTSIAWADMVRSKRLLILAPKKSAINFKKEVQLWAPHRQIIYLVGTSKKQRDIVLGQLAAVADLMSNITVIVNFEAWRRDSDLITHLKKLMFDSCIIDESHRAKEADTKIFKGIEQIVYGCNQCPGCKQFSGPSKLVGQTDYSCSLCGFSTDYNSIKKGIEWCSIKNLLETTGTSIRNRPGEIFSQLYLIDRVGFPDMSSFRQDFLAYDFASNEYTWSHGGEAALISKLGMRYLRRTEADTGMARIPVSREIVEVDFNKADYPEQWGAYWKLHDEFELQMVSGEDLPVTAVVAKFTRLQQMALWPPSIKIYGQEWSDEKQDYVNTKEVVDRVRVRESAIMDTAEDLIRELHDEGERVVVFSKYKDQFTELKERLSSTNKNGRRIKVAELTGSTSHSQIESILVDFDQRTYNDNPNYLPKYDVLLCTFAAAGESLNFTAANQGVFLDQPYNPAVRTQAEGRMDRLGQLRAVTIHNLELTTGENGRPTCYQWLNEINSRKAAIIEGFEHEANIAEMIRLEARKSYVG